MQLVPNETLAKEVKNSISVRRFLKLFSKESVNIRNSIRKLVRYSREYKLITLEALTRAMNKEEMVRFCKILNEFHAKGLFKVFEVFERTSTVSLNYYRKSAIRARVDELGPKLHTKATPEKVKVKRMFKAEDNYVFNFKHFINADSLGFIKHNNFRYVVGTKYQLDTNTLKKVASNIEKTINWNAFVKIAKELKENKIYGDVLCNIAKRMGSNRDFYITDVWLDWRGRAYTNLHQEILSPITNKWVRSALLIPNKYQQPLTKQGRLAIAQTAVTFGSRRKKFLSQKEVLIEGFKILNGELVEESDFEKVWLNRIIKEWRNVKADKNHPWAIPVEIDQTASVCSYIGAITRNKGLLEITNTIGHNGISDPWTIGNIPRDAVKLVQQIFYGSGKSLREIMSAEGFNVKEKDIREVMKALNSGVFKIAKMYAKACKSGSPASVITVNTGVDQYTFLNQHYKIEEVNEETRKVGIYENVTYAHINPLTKKVGRATFKIMTKMEQDKDRARSLYPTSLVHHLDSWTMSQVVQFFHDNGYWMIPNHDAVFCHPNMVTDVQRIVKNCLYKIYSINVLESYLTSIGAINSEDSKKLMKEVKEPTLTLEDFMAGRPMK